MDASGTTSGWARYERGNTEHELHSLDAIHLATAQQLGAELARSVTYDERMADSAAALGWTVAEPA